MDELSWPEGRAISWSVRNAAENGVNCRDVIIRMENASVMKDARITELEVALRRIDSINDNPARYSSEINDVIVAAMPQDHIGHADDCAWAVVTAILNTSDADALDGNWPPLVKSALQET